MVTGPLSADQPALMTVVVTISSPGVVEAVRRRASSISSSVISYDSGIALGEGPASTGGLDRGAFSRSVRRKIFPFPFGSEAISPFGPFSGGSPNWLRGLAHLASAYAFLELSASPICCLQ